MTSKWDRDHATIDSGHLQPSMGMHYNPGDDEDGAEGRSHQPPTADEMLMPVHRRKRVGAEEEATAALMEDVPSIDKDKLSYEIFSVLESKFLFGYGRDDRKLWLPATTAVEEASSFKNERGKVRVLCIDGGGASGLRGILPGKALACLEQALRSKSGDPDARISDYFDVAAGTGVGGVFVAMLFAIGDGVRPLFRADDAWRFLADRGERLFRNAAASPFAASSFPEFLRFLFPRGGRSETAAVERAMKEAFGEGLTLRDTVKPVLIPCYDLRTSAPLVFSRADALESESFDFRLWEVCRATWAEPGRFEPADIRSVDGATTCVGVDGGLAMSNPAAAAVTHVLHNKEEFPSVHGVEDLMVLSLGCGTASPTAAEAESGKLRLWRAKQWNQPIARIAADGSADLVDQAVALAFRQCRSSHYVRIQAHGWSAAATRNANVEEVEARARARSVKVVAEAAEEMLRQKNVESVLFGGRKMTEQSNMEKLDWFAEELVREQQRRSCRVAPTVAFKQIIPRSF